MPAAPVLPDEAARLLALSEYELSSDSMKRELARVVDLSVSLFGVPVVLVSLVEQRRQVFAAKAGTNLCETDRESSFCAHALGGRQVLVVLDALRDDRFADNPLVTGEPKIRFYAGAPLISPAGHALGTLCLIDTAPRSEFTATEQQNLADLAALVMDKLELRRLERARKASQIRFEQIAATSPDGIICADETGAISFWNDAASRQFGYTAEEILGKSIDLVLPEQMRRRMRRARDGGRPRPAPAGSKEASGATIELKGRRKDGSEFLTELSLSQWSDGDRINFGSIVRDITERRQNEDRLFRLAHEDALTGLLNRTVLRSRVTELAERSRAMSVIALDLDGFKDVNDTLGHSVGDQMLKEVGVRLLRCVRSTDTVARMGGDEFALLLPEAGDPQGAEKVAEAAIRALSQPFMLDGQALRVGASAGVATWPANSSQAHDLLTNADLALYQAKSEGRHCRRTFAEPLRRAVLNRRAYGDELRRAFEEKEFELFYQPQVRLSDGGMCGAEALLRWRHPERGLLLPGTFMPSLETSLLASEVGDWTVAEASAQAARWRRTGLPEFRVGVNLFGSQFRTGDLAEKVRGVLQRECLDPSGLELEITENIILKNDDAMTAPLMELQRMGVGIAFDDYGTGYASLSLLKRYPLTRLKIDRSFVQGICTSGQDAAIVRAVIQLGRSFGLSVIAEGVETREQNERLRQMGCNEVQGYLFGKPMPATAFAARFLGAGAPVAAEADLMEA